MHEDRDRATGTVADLESDTCYAPLRAEETARLSSPVCIRIHSLRKRLADSDGISGKAVIDGIVKAGLLADDSPEFVKEVRFSQAKTEAEEKTLIILETDKNNNVE